MGIKIFGGEGVMARMRRMGDRTNKRALLRARRGADKIVKRARQYAPVDTMDLESAIVSLETRSGTLNRRAEWLIYVDKNKMRFNQSDYHILMHENYPITAPNPKTSVRSFVKNRQLVGRLTGKVTLHNGNVVGGKYLERAIIDLEDEIAKEIEAIMNEAKL